MYFVDRNKIESHLQFIEKSVSLLEETKKWETPIEKAALERICHCIIESILDVGNAMIDGFIMRDPGSYEDIIDILEDEKVITPEMKEGIKPIIGCRKMLVQEYIQLDHEKLHHLLMSELDKIKRFPSKVRDYLTNELGPVHAFKRQ